MKNVKNTRFNIRFPQNLNHPREFLHDLEPSKLYFLKIAFPCSKKGISFQKKSFIKVILQEIWAILIFTLHKNFTRFSILDIVLSKGKCLIC